MKLYVKKYPDYLHQEVSGADARRELKAALHEIGSSILIPEAPHTGIVRRRALDRLRSGDAIWTDRNDLGRPVKGTIISLPLKILGILKEDGTYEPAADT